MNFKKPAVWVILLSVVLVVVLCIGLAANKAKGENSVTANEIRVEVTGDIPGAVIDYAKEYVGRQVDYYNEAGKSPAPGMGSYSIIEARITGLTAINTGTADLTKSISMWRLEYRLLPDHPENVLLAGGMQMEDIDGKSWIMEWGSTGQPYLLLVCDESGAKPGWQRICVTNTDAITVDYGTPEMLARYGNEYTAAAMELYHKYLEGGASGLVQLAQADLNQDGKDESVYLDRSRQMEDAGEVRVLVKDADGSEIWSEALNLSHPGWGELFLTKLDDGKQYLLRYNPVMYQGGCTYTFSLFSPEKGGKEKVLRTETLSFDINGIEALNARKMVDFADEINAILKKSTLLLSSNEGSWSFGPSSAEPFFEVYSWLDDPGLYDLGLYKKGDSLETKLEKYSAYTISNRKLSDLLYAGYTGSHSDQFSEREIRDAMESVIVKFRGFKGCEMTKLWYDEEKSNRQIESYMTGGRGAGSGVSKDNVIVIYSDFSVDSSGGDGSLNPNSTYTDWCWILVRESREGEWRVDDFGY